MIWNTSNFHGTVNHNMSDWHYIFKTAIWASPLFRRTHSVQRQDLMLSCNSRRWQGVRGKEWKRSERRKCQESICNEITVRHLRLRINFVFLKVRVCSYIWNMCIVNVVNNEKISQSARPRTFHGLPTTIVPNFGYHHARDKSVYSTYLGEHTFDLTSHDMLLFAKHYSSTCQKQSGMSNLIWYLWYIESLSIMGYKVLSHKYPITHYYLITSHYYILLPHYYPINISWGMQITTRQLYFNQFFESFLW